MTAAPGSERLLDVGSLAEVHRRRRFVVDHDGACILVLVHDGTVYAFDNVCVHRERELVKGTVFNGKLVCPGHQWAFDLTTGYEAVKQEWQPTYPVAVADDRVLLDVAGRRAPAPLAPPAPDSPLDDIA